MSRVLFGEDKPGAVISRLIAKKRDWRRIFSGWQGRKRSSKGVYLWMND